MAYKIRLTQQNSNLKIRLKSLSIVEGVSKEYVDQHDALTLSAAKTYADTKQSQLDTNQLAAVNSGVTASKVASYDDKVKVARNASETLVFYKETMN